MSGRIDKQSRWVGLICIEKGKWLMMGRMCEKKTGGEIQEPAGIS